jgi:SAM-dependent methyltransferase
MTKGCEVALIGGRLGYRLLKLVNPGGRTSYGDGSAYVGRSKLEALCGPGIWDEIRSKVVIDFGCGTGAQTIEMAQRGARRVIGIDVREEQLHDARRAAAGAGVADRCSFVTETTETADVILSLDAFEHFEDPAQILRIMRRLLADDGCIEAVFGPTWYHPLGGHPFSVFPWSHLIFTERALIRWRADFNDDGATRFEEISGGLNRMTIGRFERMIGASDFVIDRFEAVPIRRVRRLHTRLTREFFSSIVRCRLLPRAVSARAVQRQVA